MLDQQVDGRRVSRLYFKIWRAPALIQRRVLVSCKAVFVDTDNVPAHDSRVGDLVENQVEARLAYQVTECLLGCGVGQHQIGVISLYRQQLKLLSYLLQDRKELEILTADRSQGRDKDCIIISMVRSNSEGKVCLVSFLGTIACGVDGHATADRRAYQGLAPNERLFHSRTIKAHHYRLAEDPPAGAITTGLLRANG